MAAETRERTSVLVGRADELRKIDRALERLRSGHAGVVEVVGEPGIGKSCLLAELAHRAANRGCLVLDGRAAEFEHDLPFGLIIDALNDYLGTLDSAFMCALVNGTVQELAAVFPSLAGFAVDASRRPVGSDGYRFHHALRAVLERLATRRPVALALDDVHWADPASCDVIAHLLRRFRGPLLTALVFRQTPPRLAGAFEETTRPGFATRLDLGPLSSSQAQTLTGPGLDDATRAWVYRESGGNPFYLEQLVRAFPRQRRIATTFAGPTQPWAPPRAVTVAINEELAGTRKESRLVLEAAAVAGESFDTDLVAAIADRDIASTLAAIDELLEFELIRAARTQDHFRFRHPIVRRAVYDAIRHGWRLGAHARAAAALKARHAPASLRAHHVERSALAGDEQATALLLEAARGAAARAPLTAGHWLLAAVGLLTQGADPKRRLNLLVEAATALASGGAYEEALDALDEAVALSSAGAEATRGEVIATHAYVKRRSGRPFDSRPLIEGALQSVGSTDSRAAVELRLELALDHFWHSQFGPLGELAGQLLIDARERDDPALITLSAALKSLAAAEIDVEVAQVELADAQAAFARLPDEQLAERIYVSFYFAMAELRLEQGEEALAHANRGLKVARMTGQGATVSPWLAVASYASLLTGRLNEAARLAHAAIDTPRLLADDWHIIWALEADAFAAFWTGDNDRALASAREMLARSDGVHSFLSGPAQIQLAGAEYAHGDSASAKARLAALDRKATRRLLDLHAAHGWELLIRAQLALGEHDLADETAVRASRRADGAGLRQQRATVSCARAAVHLARGQAREANDLLRGAASLADAAGNPLLSARTRALVGIASIAEGRHSRGIAELERAESELRSCGAIRAADAAARELRRAGRRVPRRPRPRAQPEGSAALSPREREVAAHVASGKTNREVAAVLFLSEKTVGNHLERIFAKLGVRSRAALAARITREDAVRGAHDA